MKPRQVTRERRSRNEPPLPVSFAIAATLDVGVPSRMGELDRLFTLCKLGRVSLPRSHEGGTLYTCNTACSLMIMALTGRWGPGAPLTAAARVQLEAMVGQVEIDWTRGALEVTRPSDNVTCVSGRPGAFNKDDERRTRPINQMTSLTAGRRKVDTHSVFSMAPALAAAIDVDSGSKEWHTILLACVQQVIVAAVASVPALVRALDPLGTGTWQELELGLFDTSVDLDCSEVPLGEVLVEWASLDSHSRSEHWQGDPQIVSLSGRKSWANVMSATVGSNAPMKTPIGARASKAADIEADETRPCVATTSSSDESEDDVDDGADEKKGGESGHGGEDAKDSDDRIVAHPIPPLVMHEAARVVRVLFEHPTRLARIAAFVTPEYANATKSASLRMTPWNLDAVSFVRLMLQRATLQALIELVVADPELSRLAIAAWETAPTKINTQPDGTTPPFRTPIAIICAEAITRITTVLAKARPVRQSWDTLSRQLVAVASAKGGLLNGSDLCVCSCNQCPCGAHTLVQLNRLGRTRQGRQRRPQVSGFKDISCDPVQGILECAKNFRDRRKDRDRLRMFFEALFGHVLVGARSLSLCVSCGVACDVDIRYGGYDSPFCFGEVDV